MTFENDRALGQSDDVLNVTFLGKMTGLVGVAKCDFVSELTRPKYTNTGRLQIPTRARAKHVGSRVFLSMAPVGPILDGERAQPLAKMLLGAKHGGRPSIVSRTIGHEHCDP